MPVVVFLYFGSSKGVVGMGSQVGGVLPLFLAFFLSLCFCLFPETLSYILPFGFFLYLYLHSWMACGRPAGSVCVRLFFLEESFFFL